MKKTFVLLLLLGHLNLIQASLSTKESFDVFKLSESASADDVRKEYKRLSLLYHPDKNLNNIENAASKFKETQNAYEVIKQFFLDRGIARSRLEDDESVNILARGFTKANLSRFNFQSNRTVDELVGEKAEREKIREQQLLLRGKRFFTKRKESNLMQPLKEHLNKLQQDYDKHMNDFKLAKRNVEQAAGELERSYTKCKKELRSAQNNVETALKRNSSYQRWELYDHERNVNKEKQRVESEYCEKKNNIANARVEIKKGEDDVRQQYVTIKAGINKQITEIQQQVQQEEAMRQRQQDELYDLLGLGLNIDAVFLPRKRVLLDEHEKWFKEFEDCMQVEQEVLRYDLFNQRDMLERRLCEEHGDFIDKTRHDREIELQEKLLLQQNDFKEELLHEHDWHQKQYLKKHASDLPEDLIEQKKLISQKLTEIRELKLATFKDGLADDIKQMLDSKFKKRLMHGAVVTSFCLGLIGFI